MFRKRQVQGMCILWRNEAETSDTYPVRPQEGGDRGSAYEAPT